MVPIRNGFPYPSRQCRGSAHIDRPSRHLQVVREGIRKTSPGPFGSFWDIFATSHRFAALRKPDQGCFPGGFCSLQFASMKCSTLYQRFGDVAPKGTKTSSFSAPWWYLCWWDPHGSITGRGSATTREGREGPDFV